MRTSRQRLLKPTLKVVEVGHANVALEQLAVGIDKKGGRRDPNIAKPACPLATQVVNHLKWKIAFLDEAREVFRHVVGHRHGHDLKSTP
jgi:hypothetical protein